MRSIILSLTLLCSLLVFPPIVQAAPANCSPSSGSGNSATKSATEQALGGVGTVGGDCSGEGVDSLVKNVVTVLGYIAGIVAVIFVMIAGFKYITSNGDSQRIASAKSTLIWALVGLVIVALSQIIVRFVLGKV